MRRTVWVLASAVAVLAGAVWLWTLPSNSDGLSLGDYGSEKQHEWSERLVAGLNTHDAEQVPVLRLSGQLSQGQRSTIEAAMLAPGCRYALRAVQDWGRREQQVPGLSTVNSTYRFDATVDEQCPDQSARRRELWIVAIAEMGYWSPYYFG